MPHKTPTAPELLQLDATTTPGAHVHEPLRETTRFVTMVRASVREWYADEGWGVLESPETPGGCWVHFSVIESRPIESQASTYKTTYKTLTVGESVELEWGSPGQDGFDFRARAVRRLSDRPAIEALSFSLADGHPVDGPGWVYAWIHGRRVLYVGATWLHPAARAERHLHAETDDPRSLALREVVGRLGESPTIVGLPVPPPLERQASKASLIEACADRGWLAAEFIGPGRQDAPASSDDGWLDAALAVLADYLG